MRKRVLITGGTRGIGLATAHAFLDQEFEVFVVGCKADTKADLPFTQLFCDFSNLNSTKDFAQSLRSLELSVLINNAGINKVGPLEGYELDDFEEIHRVNTLAPLLLCQSVIPGMQKRKYGRIVNITSIYSVVSRSHRFAYSASKFGLVGLTKALALEVAKDNILINCVAPGFVDTELTRGILGEKGIADMISSVPMKRLAEPKEIAQYITFLASDKNTFMTGQNLVVDGGFTCE